MKEYFESFELDFIDRGLHRTLDADETLAFAFKAGYTSQAGEHVTEVAKLLERIEITTATLVRNNVERVSALMALEELTRPFPESLTLDDLTEHNKVIREKYKLDKLPREEKMNTSKASQESTFQRHMKTQHDIAFVAEFLTKFGGSDLHFNQYSHTILHLSGIQKGMRMSDNAHEQIAHEKDSKPEIGAQ